MSDSEGFVVIYRKIMNWEWFTDVNTSHLFLYCLLRANFKDTVWRGIEVKRGSFVTSLETLSTETGLTVKQVRNALQKLTESGEVANKSTSKYRIITVNNYDHYQQEGKQKGRQTGKLRADKRAVKGQSEGKQRATDNNNNNGTMKTSGDLCPTGTKSPHGNNENNASAPDIAPGGESVLTRQPVDPLTFKEWLDYCYIRNADKGEIPNKWFELHHGADLTEKQVVRIREIIRDGH